MVIKECFDDVYSHSYGSEDESYDDTYFVSGPRDFQYAKTAVYEKAKRLFENQAVDLRDNKPGVGVPGEDLPVDEDYMDVVKNFDTVRLKKCVDTQQENTSGSGTDDADLQDIVSHLVEDLTRDERNVIRYGPGDSMAETDFDDDELKIVEELEVELMENAIRQGENELENQQDAVKDTEREFDLIFEQTIQEYTEDKIGACDEPDGDPDCYMGLNEIDEFLTQEKDLKATDYSNSFFIAPLETLEGEHTEQSNKHRTLMEHDAAECQIIIDSIFKAVERFNNEENSSECNSSSDDIQAPFSSQCEEPVHIRPAVLSMKCIKPKRRDGIKLKGKYNLPTLRKK